MITTKDISRQKQNLKNELDKRVTNMNNRMNEMKKNIDKVKNEMDKEEVNCLQRYKQGFQIIVCFIYLLFPIVSLCFFLSFTKTYVKIISKPYITPILIWVYVIMSVAPCGIDDDIYSIPWQVPL